MKKKYDVFNLKLNKEEQELLDSVERGEWKSVKNYKKEADFARKAAVNFLRRGKTIK